jgi:hypothetical protein
MKQYYFINGKKQAFAEEVLRDTPFYSKLLMDTDLW